MSEESWDPPCFKYENVRTFIFDENTNQVAHLDIALWLPVGSVIELGDPNRDAVVQDVRLSLPQNSHPSRSAAVIYVYTDDAGVEGKRIPRNAAERFLIEHSEGL